jgi:hypothetical protein
LCAAAAVAGLLPVATGPAHAEAPNTCSSVRVNSPIGTWRSDRLDAPGDVDWFRFSMDGSHPVLLTLGGLPADMSLGLYDGSCRLLARSEHPGREFEEIYRRLPSGRYYARVWGEAGAIGTYDLRFRPLRTGMVVLSSRSARSDNVVRIVGELMNTSTKALELPETDAILYDARNRVVTTDTCCTYGLVVAPGARVPFEMQMEVPPSYDHYRLIAAAYDQGAVPIRNVRLSAATAADNGTTRWYSGTVYNGNTRRATEVVVWATLRDAHGYVINTAGSYPGDIPAHGSRPWTLEFDNFTGANRISFGVDARL